MRDPENIQGLSKLEPDFMGFIFYPKSSRFVESLDEKIVLDLPPHIQKVGVFVNETVDHICACVSKFELDYVQLHGDEDKSFVKVLRTKGINVIKVFRVLDTVPANIQDYVGLVDYFLFDTSTVKYGGSGKQFDWNILKEVEMSVPFLLSGGIRLEDIEQIKALKLPMLYGIDVNSQFEVAPGLKDIARVRELIKQL